MLCAERSQVGKERRSKGEGGVGGWERQSVGRTCFRNGTQEDEEEQEEDERDHYLSLVV